MRKEWLTAKEAAAYAKCGRPQIYRGVRHKRLRAARLNGLNNLRFLPEWIDQWLLEAVTEPEPLASTAIPTPLRVASGQ